MLCEWAANNADSSKRMLAILMKYANIDRQALIKEIEVLSDKLSKLPEQDIIKKLQKEMQERVKKYEQTIKDRKTVKFRREKLDYQRGQIFTFSKRFANIRRQQMTDGLRSNTAQMNVESGSEISSEADTDNEDTHQTISVPSVEDELRFLRWDRNTNLRPLRGQERTFRGGGRGRGKTAGPGDQAIKKTNTKKNK